MAAQGPGALTTDVLLNIFGWVSGPGLRGLGRGPGPARSPVWEGFPNAAKPCTSSRTPALAPGRCCSRRLDCESLLRAGWVCRAWHQALDSTEAEQLWRQRLQADWGLDQPRTPGNRGMCDRARTCYLHWAHQFHWGGHVARSIVRAWLRLEDWLAKHAPDVLNSLKCGTERRGGGRGWAFQRAEPNLAARIAPGWQARHPPGVALPDSHTHPPPAAAAPPARRSCSAWMMCWNSPSPSRFARCSKCTTASLPWCSRARSETCPGTACSEGEKFIYLYIFFGGGEGVV